MREQDVAQWYAFTCDVDNTLDTFCSHQCFITDVTKVMVCTILSEGWYIQKMLCY